MSRLLFTVVLVLMIALAACAPAPTAAPPTQPAPTDAPPTAVPPTEAPPTEPAVTPTPIHVDLTPAQLAAVQALAAQLGIGVENIELISTEAVTWPDGCLGIVRPEALCLQGQVEGFRIILKAADETYEYHTNQDGSVVALLEESLPSLRIAVRALDNSIQIVETSVPIDPADLPLISGFLPVGGVAGNTVFALSLDGQPPQAVALDPANPIYPPAVHPLDFIANANYGLAVWPGDAGTGPLLAWATQPDATSGETMVLTAAPDGTLVVTLVTEDGFAGPPYQLVVEGWAADGQSLYFSREPYGIGGYIPFAGASSLYRVSLADQTVTELLPFSADGGPMICLDDMSSDETLVADHCAAGLITVRNLASAQTTTIRPPADASGYGLLGSARFRPDGSRVAFALAVGDPAAEQGWIAVSDGLAGDSRLIATSRPGESYSVVGWLNSSTLLVQSTAMDCGADCVNELWTLGVDGGDLFKVADGNFVTLVDGYQP